MLTVQLFQPEETTLIYYKLVNKGKIFSNIILYIRAHTISIFYSPRMYLRGGISVDSQNLFEQISDFSNGPLG